MIGENELFNCFRDMKGVDVKLVDLAWFKNHFKWIAWKLLAYDMRFANSFSQVKVLNPCNILLQIKYRYDVEIGCARR